MLARRSLFFLRILRCEEKKSALQAQGTWTSIRQRSLHRPKGFFLALLILTAKLSLLKKTILSQQEASNSPPQTPWQQTDLWLV